MIDIVPDRSNDLTALIARTLSETITDLAAKIDQLRRCGPDEISDPAVAGVVDDLRQLVVFLKYSGQYLRHQPRSHRTREEILRVKLHLLSVLRALSDQVRLRDRIAVHDLITEELRDNLTQWKISVIPLLRASGASATGSSHV